MFFGFFFCLWQSSFLNTVYWRMVLRILFSLYVLSFAIIFPFMCESISRLSICSAVLYGFFFLPVSYCSGGGNGNPLQFLPGKSHGQRGLAGYSSWGHKRVEHNCDWTHHTVQITVVTLCTIDIYEHTLKSGCMVPPTLFFLKTVLDIYDLLWFHKIFRVFVLVLWNMPLGFW